MTQTCMNCHAVEQKLEKCSEELMGAYDTIKAQGKELTRLKKQISDETTPLAQGVRKVLDKWAETHPGANTDPLGYRAALVRTAAKLGHTNPPIMCPVHHVSGKRDKDAVCTVFDELIEAMEGIALMPFQGKTGRSATPNPGFTRRDGVEYALTDRKRGAVSEAKIEEFRAYARWAKMASSERLWVAYKRTGQVHDEYSRLLLDALNREAAVKETERGRPANVIDITTARKAA